MKQDLPTDIFISPNPPSLLSTIEAQKLVTVKPKMFKKLTEAQTNFPMWVGAIAGVMGEATSTGFILENPNIQVFEKKPKAEAVPAD
jgi:hypothetical protein